MSEQQTRKAKVIKGLIAAAAIFFLLFGFRLGYGYITVPDANTSSSGVRAIESVGYIRRNYAGKKMLGKSAKSGTSQKYEKIAKIQSQSGDFSNDDKKIRGSIKENKALIQYEQSGGLKGRRFLKLIIGVPPDAFDVMLTQVQKIGIIKSINVDKKDKTNEYKELGAKRASLEKTRQSLQALKQKGGSVRERIELENRLLEIEEAIQNLAVQLGDFDSENEFVTIDFALFENQIIGIPFMQRLKVAFEWTVKYYLLLLVIITFAVAGILVGIIVLEKLHWLPSFARQSLDK